MRASILCISARWRARMRWSAPRMTLLSSSFRRSTTNLARPWPPRVRAWMRLAAPWRRPSSRARSASTRAFICSSRRRRACFLRYAHCRRIAKSCVSCCALRSSRASSSSRSFSLASSSARRSWRRFRDVSRATRCRCAHWIVYHPFGNFVHVVGGAPTFYEGGAAAAALFRGLTHLTIGDHGLKDAYAPALAACFGEPPPRFRDFSRVARPKAKLRMFPIEISLYENQRRLTPFGAYDAANLMPRAMGDPAAYARDGAGNGRPTSKAPLSADFHSFRLILG